MKQHFTQHLLSASQPPLIYMFTFYMSGHISNSCKLKMTCVF